MAHGSVNSEIIVELPGGTEITSIITKNSAEKLGLKEGHEIYTVIKATSAMLAYD
ncbi:TOBE domain-containing protein [Methanosarcina sp.]|uniref:TOBE domain-containing protein n=1 Tax=Methanosarcina sp. TaxID=2213 RepID=UPI002ABB5E1F|nr:TOBE domain-containing protein [Methanosarcina sp.]MDY9927011.1 TOBE domain-containing protein [Methanosarcina sp.]